MPKVRVRLRIFDVAEFLGLPARRFAEVGVDVLCASS